jgi:transketolase
MEIFNAQSDEYKNNVISPDTIGIAIEASRGLEWYRYAKIVIGMESFGASGEAGMLFEHFGFTQEAICAKVRSLK